MTCEEFQSRYLAGDVTTTEMQHLRTCSACASVRGDLDDLRAILAEQTMWEQPDAELADRVVAAVRAEAAPADRQPSGGRSWRVAVAAAAVVAVVFGGWWLGRSDRPDWTVELAATGMAPGATAVVDGWNTVSGTRMVFAVEGLDPLGDGAYYEIWLTAPDGRHVSAGTFRASGEVTAWAGVRRADFPRIWITLEPADDEEAPSPDTVLDTPGAF